MEAHMIAFIVMIVFFVVTGCYGMYCISKPDHTAEMLLREIQKALIAKLDDEIDVDGIRTMTKIQDIANRPFKEANAVGGKPTYRELELALQEIYTVANEAMEGG